MGIYLVLWVVIQYSLICLVTHVVWDLAVGSSSGGSYLLWHAKGAAHIFNWSIVDLQCRVNFCCTAKWFSFIYMYIHIYTHTHRYIYTHIYIHIYKHTHRYIYTHIYIHIYTHTHTHTHTHTFFFMFFSITVQGAAQFYCSEFSLVRPSMFTKAPKGRNIVQKPWMPLGLMQVYRYNLFASVLPFLLIILFNMGMWQWLFFLYHDLSQSLIIFGC